VTTPSSPSARPWIERHAAAAVREALSDTRVVVIGGPRQVGKSTLARHVVAHDPTAVIATFDDAETLAAARGDPKAFLRHEGTLVLDEIQLAPDLYRSIKAAVDRDRRPGRFLLTGSANVFLLPRLADALTGRMEVVELWSFSQGELAGTRERFVDLLLDGGEALRVKGTDDKLGYLSRAVRGGFPEAVARPSEASRTRWYASYLADVVRNDVAALADIDRLHDFPKIVRLVAARTATVLNVEGLARDARLPPSTMRRYLTLLDATCLLIRLPAWSSNRTSRAVRAPKIHLADSGLAAHLVGASAKALERPPSDAGTILETFVVMELRRQLGWAAVRATLGHFRTRDGVEVDVVIETADGRVAGIEVKAGHRVAEADFRGLRHLRDRAGGRFAAGVVLYAGETPLPFGDGLWAVPISALWT
jgi:predicted AAA+ superfamily ATPase